jgi:hypothetical protein
MLDGAVVFVVLVSILSTSNALFELSTEPGMNWSTGEMGGGGAKYDDWGMAYTSTTGGYGESTNDEEGGSPCMILAGDWGGAKCALLNEVFGTVIGGAEFTTLNAAVLSTWNGAGVEVGGEAAKQ